MIASRRRFLMGAGALLAAPAIVRVASIMPVSVPKTVGLRPWLSATYDSVWADEASNVTLEDIIRAKEALDANDVPLPTWWAVSPKFADYILANPEWKPLTNAEPWQRLLYDS